MISERSEYPHHAIVWHSVAALMLPILLLVSSTQVYAATFGVSYVNTTPKETPQGQVIQIVFGVSYAQYHLGMGPAELRPRAGQTQPTGSFAVLGSPALRFIDIPLNPTGKPGEYRAELRWPSDAPIGRETIYIIQGSLYDGETTGPVRDTSHLETPEPADNSEFFSRSANPIMAMFDFVPRDMLTTGTSMTLGIILAELLQSTGELAKFLHKYSEKLLYRLFQKSGQNLFQKLVQKSEHAQRFLQRLLGKRVTRVFGVGVKGHLERKLAYESITVFIPFFIVFFALRHLLSSLTLGEIKSDTVSAVAGAIFPWLLSSSGVYGPLQKRFGLNA